MIVTVVARSAPAGPAAGAGAATDTVARGNVLSARRFAYWVMVACGLPMAACQFTMSRWVDSQ